MLVVGVQNALNFVFFCLFPGHLLSISELKFQRLGFGNRGFRTDAIVKNRLVLICRLLEALGTVFLIFWALKTGLET